SKQHKGVDFGAPVGARVMAAGEGVVVKAGWNGAYGNYVLIRHNSDYSTAYAHLSKISVKAGMRVKQHQEIGKVGMTGRSTGPHLHYEVIYRGHHVNPQSIKQLPATKLDAKEMARFQTVRAQIDEKVASGVVSELVAQSLPIRTG
ncbi:MAG TPA: M23 family metallopeptidase, partial [Candidatus Nitrosotenuis sp.]|nr:M23 family metallopeptidase [Candidatus Nitrosotenuis sp.]